MHRYEISTSMKKKIAKQLLLGNQTCSNCFYKNDDQDEYHCFYYAISTAPNSEGCSRWRRFDT